MALDMLVGTDVVKGLALTIFQTLLTAGGKAIGQLGETFQQEVFRASKQYNQNYSARHGSLKVLGMREPIKLESVYVAVQFLDNRAIRRFETIEALEQIYRRPHQRGFHLQDNPHQLGLEVANQTQYLMVLGGPGMGKSTFLRKVGLVALEGKTSDGYHHDCIPVLIDLKDFRFGKIDFEGAIAREFETCGFPHHQSFTTEALKQGKLLLLLDGLDEVPTERMSEMITKMRNFVDRYDQNRFIISCRLAAYRHNFRRFTDVEILDFGDRQIQSFIQNWFVDCPSKGEECWQKLASDEYTAAKELTHSPLLLTLTCLLYERAGQFPTNRATLYEKALRVLLEEWAGEKGLPYEPLYRGLDTKRKELVLSKIAYDAFVQDRLFLPKRELAKQLEILLGEMLPDEQLIDGYAVLRSIEVQHGILVERAESIYSFSHLTLQEFLAAQHIVDTRQNVADVVTHHLTDSRWREVFLHLAGLQQADDLLSLMEQQAALLIDTPTLHHLLAWANQETRNSPSTYKTAAKRTIALFLALDLARSLAIDQARVRALDFAIDRARILALELDPSLTLNRALDLALVRALNLDRALELIVDIARNFDDMHVFSTVEFNVLIARLEALRVQIPRHQKSLATRNSFIQQIHQIWLNALHLYPEWIDLSHANVTALDQFLYANVLMVQCRCAAVWVSPKTWHEIENRLLSPQPNTGWFHTLAVDSEFE